MNIRPSISEDNGIAALTDDDLQIYSVGISTGGIAEIRMAEQEPRRHIIATTIDKEGAEFAKKYIADKHLSDRIEVKIEDVVSQLPYADNSFDYIYARLVLHYLPEDTLIRSLSELHRVVKTGGRIFIVVRSTDCPDARQPDVVFNPVSHMTTRTYVDSRTGKMKTQSRYFHTQESIKKYVMNAGFNVAYVKAYDEQLCSDFMRTKLSSKVDNVIELTGIKRKYEKS